MVLLSALHKTLQFLFSTHPKQSLEWGQMGVGVPAHVGTLPAFDA